MYIKDIMTKEVITVSKEDTIETCAKLLSSHGLSGLPVVNDFGLVLGIVTEGDLIKRSSEVQTPAYLELLGGIIYFDNPNKFFADVKKTMGLLAEEVMSKNVVTISPDETIENAASIIVRQKLKRLPVVNEIGKLVGIVARRDIMNHLFQGE